MHAGSAYAHERAGTVTESDARAKMMAMTKLLDEAVAKARQLPPESQDALAALLLDEIERDVAWDRRLARSPALLAELAEAARREVAAGAVADGDPSKAG